MSAGEGKSIEFDAFFALRAAGMLNILIKSQEDILENMSSENGKYSFPINYVSPKFAFESEPTRAMTRTTSGFDSQLHDTGLQVGDQVEVQDGTCGGVWLRGIVQEFGRGGRPVVCTDGSRKAVIWYKTRRIPIPLEVLNYILDNSKMLS